VGKRAATRVRVGCSGWNYRSWKGTFYPAGLDPGEWLPFYAAVFDTVELNGTFYRLPERSTFIRWRGQVPPGFCAAMKASRYLTHLKRLLDPAEPIARLFDRARGLGPVLGPILYQLPPQMKLDFGRLEAFLAILPKTLRGIGALDHVFEFRDPSWYVAEVIDLIAAHGASICLHDKLGSEYDGDAAGPLTYVRFHGTSGQYHGSYDRRQLRPWARRLVADSRRGQRVFAYFNNDPEAVATFNARELRTMIEEERGE
jgi:uncharacterized protein YecE (DUF72 family)